MTTRSELAAVVEASFEAGSRAAIALVVETDGSVYRRAGARSVVTEDGTIHGIISGGCAEQDLLERAKVAWQTGSVQRMTYDFRSHEDLLWGMGAGCNGSLTVCLVPMDPGMDGDVADRVVADMRRRADTKTPYVSVTVLETSDPSKVALGPLDDAQVTQLCSTGVLTLSAADTPRLATIEWDGVTLEVFAEHVTPRSRLVVFGAGDDARPVVRMAADVDWHTTVIDHRALFNNATRFPSADGLEVIRRDAYGTVNVDDDAFVVVMTHNYELDQMILANVLPRAVRYVGVLGPRRRFERLLKDIIDAGGIVTDADMRKVHSPVGLDIGAETAEDIALSIVGEIMACRRDRSGRSLHLRVGEVVRPETSS